MIFKYFIFLITIADIYICSNSEYDTYEDKVRSLSACLKLSKARQNQDKFYYSDLLNLVDNYYKTRKEKGIEEVTSPSDFIAYTIVQCYTQIDEKLTNLILETKVIDSGYWEMKNLLKLEEAEEMLRSGNGEEIEKEIVKFQDKLYEVIMLTKEAEILNQGYYNIEDETNIQLSFGEKALGLVLYIFYEMTFQNFMFILVIISLVVYLVINKRKEKVKKSENSYTKTNSSEYRKKKKNK